MELNDAIAYERKEAEALNGYSIITGADYSPSNLSR